MFQYFLNLGANLIISQPRDSLRLLANDSALQQMTGLSLTILWRQIHEPRIAASDFAENMECTVIAPEAISKLHEDFEIHSHETLLERIFLPIWERRIKLNQPRIQYSDAASEHNNICLPGKSSPRGDFDSSSCLLYTSDAADE